MRFWRSCAELPTCQYVTPVNNAMTTWTKKRVNPGISQFAGGGGGSVIGRPPERHVHTFGDFGDLIFQWRCVFSRTSDHFIIVRTTSLLLDPRNIFLDLRKLLRIIPYF